MGEMKVPEMRGAMREVGKMMLGEIEGGGFSVAIMTEMGEGGSLAEPYRFRTDECATVNGFMASAKSRICERVKGGATVVLVGVAVMLHETGSSAPEGTSLEETRRRLTEEGIEVLPGTVVFGFNRREFAAELYTRTCGLADMIRSQSEDNLVRTLRQVSDYLFKDVPWPRVH